MTIRPYTQRMRIRSFGNTLSLAVLLLVFLSSCGTLAPAPEIPPDLDTYEGLAAAIALDRDILIYDVRSAAEAAAGMIPGAINIPHTEIAEALPGSYRNKVIVVYCQSGGRSRAAYEALTEKGFKYVFDFGSILNWKDEIPPDCGCT